ISVAPSTQPIVRLRADSVPKSGLSKVEMAIEIAKNRLPKAGFPNARLPTQKMINIGGRPVMVSNSQSAGLRDRADTIKMALAFAAIYIVWGSTYLAIRYAVATIPPLVTAGVRRGRGRAGFGLRASTGFRDVFWARCSF